MELLHGHRHGGAQSHKMFEADGTYLQFGNLMTKVIRYRSFAE